MSTVTQKTITHDGNTYLKSLLWKDLGATLTTTTATKWAWDNTPIKVYFANDYKTWNLPANPNETAQFMLAWSKWEAVTNVDFELTADISQANLIEHRVGSSEIPGFGRHYNPDIARRETEVLVPANDPLLSSSPTLHTGANSVVHGYFNVELERLNAASKWVEGAVGFRTLMHELGHSIGLSHPFDDGGLGKIPAKYDNMFYTIMSYNLSYNFDAKGIIQISSGALPSLNYGYFATPAPIDIAAIQNIYGAKNSNTGNDTYSLNQVEDKVGVFWQTIWDTGGVDEIKFSGPIKYLNGPAMGQPVEVVIDLRAATLDNADTDHLAGGMPSYVKYIHGGYEIARGVVIENATGGIGNDKITGNEANNVIRGNGGNDDIDGGNGADTAVYRSYKREYDIIQLGPAEYRIDHKAGGQVDGTDTLKNIEKLRFLDGDFDIAASIAGAGKLDFVFLQDLSGSFGDDITTVKGIAPSLLSGIKSFASSAQFGVTSFVDKPTAFGGSPSDYEYQLHLGLTTSDSAAINALNAMMIFNGGDLPESQLTGLYEVGTDAGIGFRPDSEKIVLLLTDASYHAEAGYPSIASIKAVYDNLKITPIFAVTSGNESTYNGLVSALGRGQVVTLTSNSDNIVDAVSQAIGTASGPPVVPGATSGADSLLGTGGADRFFLGLGNDWADGGLDDDDMDGGANNDTLIGGVGFDVLRGGTGIDTLWGGILNASAASDDDSPDLLIGGEGADTHNGGAGYDTVAFAAAVVLDLDNRGADSGESGGDVYNSIERFVGSSAGDTISGSNVTEDDFAGAGGNDVLRGRAGDDTLAGDDGADQLFGDDGDDRLYFDSADTVVQGGAGVDTAIVQSGSGAVFVDLSAQGLERVVGGDGADQIDATDVSVAVELSGGAGNDQLTGGTGNDKLDGGDGNDTMSGGRGDDTYTVSVGNDTINEAVGEGTDIVRTDRTVFVLGNNIENLAYTGYAGFSGTGNGLNNELTGSLGNDRLDGGAGNDTMRGGLGDDSYYVDSSADVVIEDNDQIGDEAGIIASLDTVYATADFRLSANLENLVLQGSANLLGYGNAQANTIIGNAGANVLDGRGGADVMQGFGGNDTYWVDNVSDRAIEAVGVGSDRVITSVSYTLEAGSEIELFTTDNAGSTVALNLTGNGFANSMQGNAGANVLDGRGGADLMQGFGGNDTYWVDNALDRAIEAVGAGSDRVITSVSYALEAGREIELITTTNAGSTVALNLTGNEFANSMQGNAGTNVLDGRGGIDVMQGFGGNDTYWVDNALDRAIEAVGTGSDRVITSVSYTLEAGSEIELITTNNIGSMAALNLTGNGFANSMQGNAGANVLDGRGGADLMQGFGGNDTYWVDNALDRAIEAVGAGSDRVVASVSYILEAGREIEQLTTDNAGSTAALNLTGNEFANSMTGNAGANVLDGRGGVDVMRGLGGSDTYWVDSVSDRAIEAVGAGSDRVVASVSYTLEAGSEIELFTTDNAGSTVALNLTGNEFANSMTGNAGANVLDGRGGVDVMRGLGGSDTYWVDSVSDRAIEAVGAGSDRVVASVSYTLEAGSEIELFTTDNAGSTAALNLTGNEFANSMTGNAGANVLDGRGGVDVMRGLGGSDTYWVDSVSDRAIEAVGAGSDRVVASVSYALEAGSEIELFTTDNAGSTVALNLTGNEFANSMQGNAGANVLDGRGGADVMQGFGGNDTYWVDNAADRAIEAVGGGSDRVITSVSYTLEAGREIELFTTNNAGSTVALNLTGNEFANSMQGNAGANVLDGRGGIDVMQGFGGNDTYWVDNALDRTIEAVGAGSDRVITSVSYTLEAGREIELITTDNTGSTVALNLTGNEFANSMQGNAGANVLDGRGGADVMQGFGGNDTYWVDNAADRAIEAVGGGSDRVITSVSYTLEAGREIELFTTNNAGSTVALNLTGNEFANSMQGNAGANVLDGRGGIDVMQGFGGNDTYWVDNALDRTIEAVGAGSDRVITSVSYTLEAGREIELITTDNTGSTVALNLTGNEFANSMQGNAGANVLDGRGGADLMQGFGGNDIYWVDNALDRAIEAVGAGSDRVVASVSYILEAGSEIEQLTTDNAGSTAALNLTGNGFANSLTGNAGNNTLNGGAGNDTLTGLAGQDNFLFDTNLGASNVDTITDFNVTNDTIQLENGIFSALVTTGTLGDSAFFTGAAAHDADDRIVYNATTGALLYDADGTGAGAAIQFAMLGAGLSVTHLDFLVI